MTEENFGTLNFILFISSLAMAIFVGLYHGYRDRKKQNLENFYFGSRQISPLMLAASMAVTFISAIAYISIPVMIYQQGTKNFWVALACVLPAIPCNMFVLPLLFRIQPSNIYEIFQLRYNSTVKKLCAGVFIFQQIAFMSIVTQMTASALSLVTPISVNWSIVTTVFICSTYTTLGGLKAIVWVDGIQSLIMIAGGLTVFIYSLVEVGGLNKAIQDLNEAGLNNFFDFKPNLQETYSFWSYTFGVSFAYMSYVGTNQSMTQRLQSCKNKSDAKKTLMMCMVFISILFFMGAMNGVPMVSYFKGCDPLKAGEIDFADQMIPFMVMRLFRNMPGFAGLFVSSVYSGMLSTVSSGTNSVAMTIFEVFIRPNLKEVNDDTGLKISRILSFVLFLLIMVLSMLVSKLGNVAYSLLTTVDSMFNTPMNSLLIAGTVFPWITKMGGIFGFIVGIFFNAWVTIGQQVWGKTHKDFFYEGSTDNCTSFVNSGFVQNFTVENTSDFERPLLTDTLYQIPIPYLGFIGFFNTLVCALVFSFLTGHQSGKNADSRLFVPLVSSKLFPDSVRKFFRFGVPEYLEPSTTDEQKSLQREDFKIELL